MHPYLQMQQQCRDLLHLEGLACLTIIAFIMTGCTTLRPMQLSRSQDSGSIIIGDSIHPGDEIKITTTDGKQYEFKVTAVEDDHLKAKLQMSQ